jgi:hypothetical protein
MTRRIAHAAPIGALVLALALVPAALAARAGGSHGGGGGGTGSGSSLSLVMVADANSDGLPNWNDTVTFDVSTTVTDSPRVAVDCYQNGTHVYWASAAWYAGNPWPWLRNFNLNSTYWTGGAADCTAQLQAATSKRTTVLATLNFHVAA